MYMRDGKSPEVQLTNWEGKIRLVFDDPQELAVLVKFANGHSREFTMPVPEFRSGKWLSSLPLHARIFVPEHHHVIEAILVNGVPQPSPFLD
jgi:hypothetical protein